ncbi:MAG: SH3 domain-containing protein [Flavobacteriales bacterium]|nr:SH3 domain-containing protein [Flavobacteriales bacterium]
MKNKITYSFLLFCLLTFSQTEYKVNTEVLNVRSGAGTKYDVVGQIKLDEKVVEVSKSGDWSEIKTQELQGFVSSKFISKINTENNTKDEKSEDEGSFFGWLITLVIIAYFIRKATDFLSGLFGGSKASSRAHAQNAPKKVTSYHLSIKNGVVYLGKERSTMQSPVFQWFEKAIDCDLENPTDERSRFLVVTTKGEVILCRLKSTGKDFVFRPFVSYGSAYKARFADSNSFVFTTEKGTFKGYFNSTRKDKLS